MILLIKRRFIPTDMESICCMNMMPLRSTGHKEMWVTAKHNNLEEEQKSCTIHSLEWSWHCSNDAPDISQTLMTSVISCTFLLSMACYGCWSSAIIPKYAARWWKTLSAWVKQVFCWTFWSCQLQRWVPALGKAWIEWYWWFLRCS